MYARQTIDVRGELFLETQTDMAETAESDCIRLKLNDGGQVYVESVWRSASFAITVLDGARAWSHSGMLLFSCDRPNSSLRVLPGAS
jgi:hypothetical protein